jgi:adenylate cyclase
MSEEEPGGGTAGKKVRLSLKLKLSVLITSLLALTIAALGIMLAQQEQQNLKAEMTKRGLTIARNLANSAKNPILTNDDLTLSLLVQDTTKDPDVAYVVLADADGKVVAHQDLGLIGKPLSAAELSPVDSDLRVQSSVDAKHGQIMPLVFSNVRVGSLYLGFSERTIQEALQRARLKTLVLSAVMVLVGILGAMALATLIARPVLRLAEGTRAIAAGDLSVSVPVTSGDEIGLLAASFNQMARSLREKEMIKRAFTRYVAREVVDEILKNPERLALKEERRDVTVLFCDMRGFTTMSERLSPEEVVAVLNEFYTLMIDTTFKQDGTLDKFLGDGVMSIFGAPILHSDHSIRAVRTALAMQAGVAELSRKRLKDGKDPIAVGIGISAGEAVAGTVGTEDRMEYTVIGDSVNLAARLESNAKPGQILISERTYRNVEGRVNVRPLGALRLKGKEEHVQVYEVLGLAHGS